ncbi:Quinol monooxygenase YgiN [Parasphingorhabdus marina DSM 22363]|uniref:Quinol monooxygenase YgiN n=1 Tax=Parasphingorhabdus marina DSM 22363 TaxID=1123272 RepID=A0A1N6HKR2_9SPHN|nr:antibiotic biosynthesis monooxygenase [Parasphingorhabdus marina]SIO20370.1 Quinol monooxygenase YgiN [Parasphingorhabdus marina DSM 22363]
MTTLLAHIKIKPGKAEKWEAIMADMVEKTFETETGVNRYEYWKGQEENFYYCLLSFEDKWAFYRHQISDHHESHEFADVLADIRLEYVDPVTGAGGGLADTRDPALPDDADEGMAMAQERFPLDIAGWWTRRK